MGDRKMAKVLVVTSGKGGVGKTTSTAALGAALAQAGQKVAVIDFDVGLRNLDLVMGAERRVVFDLRKTHAHHSLRPATCEARRNAQHRRCSRHPFHTTSRDYSGKSGGPARLQSWLARYAMQCSERSGACLPRRRAPAQGWGRSDEHPR